ncbi:unnamed protein product [Rangifer tarandus platyrhynchus]|uniref:Uncharacterized protein n=2 Tax=Rangifer tarandus platyrhynchus TaxID=3082113 RepID=A0AC60A1F6_RANTA|nr:unnamed protein product [Rangifer tarandus platyrhynchus]
MKLELPGRENRNSKLNQPSDWKPVQGVVKHSFWLNGRGVLEAKLAGSVQFSPQSCPTLCYPMNRSKQASLSITNYRSLLKLMSIESVMPSSHLILCRPLLLLPSIPSSIRVFSSESTLHEVAKVLEC